MLLVVPTREAGDLTHVASTPMAIPCVGAEAICARQHFLVLLQASVAKACHLPSCPKYGHDLAPHTQKLLGLLVLLLQQLKLHKGPPLIGVLFLCFFFEHLFEMRSPRLLWLLKKCIIQPPRKHQLRQWVDWLRLWNVFSLKSKKILN